MAGGHGPASAGHAEGASSHDHKGASDIRKIAHLIIPQRSSQVAAFPSGQLDVPSVPDSQWRPNAHDPCHAFDTIVSGFERTLDDNRKEPFFQNAKVGQALSCAIDRRASIEGDLAWVAYGQVALATPKRFRDVTMDPFIGGALWDNASVVNP